MANDPELIDPLDLIPVTLTPCLEAIGKLQLQYENNTNPNAEEELSAFRNSFVNEVMEGSYLIHLVNLHNINIISEKDKLFDMFSEFVILPCLAISGLHYDERMALERFLRECIKQAKER